MIWDAIALIMTSVSCVSHVWRIQTIDTLEQVRHHLIRYTIHLTCTYSWNKKLLLGNIFWNVGFSLIVQINQAFFVKLIWKKDVGFGLVDVRGLIIYPHGIGTNITDQDRITPLVSNCSQVNSLAYENDIIKYEQLIIKIILLNKNS